MSQYRMGPIGILTEFNAKVVSNYYKEQKIPIKQPVKDKDFIILVSNINKE